MRAIASFVCLLALFPIASVAQHAIFAASGGPAMNFTLTSSAFSAGGEIPEQYTCKGQDVSPALHWSGAPLKTGSFALVMDDPDAPSGVWVHWVLWNLPASTHALSEGVDRGEMDDGAQQGRNSFQKTGYNGPCPPVGQTHRYLFRLYALDGKLELQAGASRSDLDAAMKGHVLGHAELMGTFHK